MTTYPQYKRALTDPMPRRAEAYRLYGPGGQHSSPQPREHQGAASPTWHHDAQINDWPRTNPPIVCVHCGWMATSSPCQSCIGQQPPPPPPPKEPATIEMGPLPTDLAIDDRTCADVTSAGQCCDPEPLPVAWAAYSPDMSCYAVDPATMTAGDIDHRGLTWAISQGEITMHGSYWRSLYQGRLVTETQQSILQWMRARGGNGSNLHNCRLSTNTYDLSITCMGERTTIEMIDYGNSDPVANAMLANAAAPAVEIGGVAW